MLPKVRSSTQRYQGRAFSVRVDEVEFQPGKSAPMDVIVHPGAVTILPLDAEGQLWFIRQYRHPVGEVLLELPAGTLKPDEDAAVAANRELQEEIGMAAGYLERLCTFWLAPGYSTELMHIYLATALSPSQLDQDEDEAITVEKITTTRAVAMADTGELRDAKSLVGVLVAARKLGW